MKLYIADGVKLSKFNLPHEIRESILIPYKLDGSKKDYTLSIEASEGKWALKSNGVINVLENGSTVLDCIMKPYVQYECEIVSEKKIINVCLLPVVEEKTINVSLYGVNQVTIGNTPSNNICFNNNHIISNHVIMNVQNGRMVLTAAHPGVYVNGLAVGSAILNMGDIIYIQGLKIIYMRDFLKMNNVMESVIINGLQGYEDLSETDNTVYEKVDSSESDIELYATEDYFFHKPRIKDYVEEEKVVIDAPPEKDKSEQLPFILSIGTSLTMFSSSFIMMFSMYTGVSSGKKTIVDSIPQIVMCVSMVIGSLIMPRVINAYQNKQRKKREKLRQEKYREYLKKKENEINQIIEKQVNCLINNFPNDVKCSEIITNKEEQLWERQIVDDDFLQVSVGLGECPANIAISAPEKHFTLDEDDLKDIVYDMVNRSRNLTNVPIVYSMIKNKISALIIDNNTRKKYLNNLLLQLITLHSAVDLKLVFFMEDTKNLEYVKFLPHCWSEDKNARYFASDLSDMKNIAIQLEGELKQRITALSSAGKDEHKDVKQALGYKNYSCYYLIITDCYRKIKDLELINELLKQDQNYGFSLLFVDSNLGGLPPKCSSFIFADPNNSHILEPNEKNNIKRKFNLPSLNNFNMEILSSILFNIPIMAKEGKAELPKSLSFLEMYNISKIEQLNILNRWENNDPVTNLKTPIGIHADRELFMLDLHEKAHGPHGLIAGSTGSGKSEFIITFVLSMAINFHPNDVQFVLIDYKGGGLAGAFENREKGICLPHLAGTITNLDTAEMNRTLVSINSELKRRQKKFNEIRDSLGEGTIDIYKYQKLYKQGKIKEPMAHLFIISDEFAELKSQQPEFMQELISTARIGRSLGVHLILATQKPTGVVNDQIWANSKFKICLKVQDRSDSMEMLKRPEAASIKETGRFYLQVGYDEYFDIGQSGWSGAKYIPSDRIVKKVDDSIKYINNIGDSIKVINDEIKVTNTKDEYGDQLTNTVKYIVDVARQERIKIRKLWLSSIPEIIYLQDLMEKYEYKSIPYLINPIIGEFDNPSSQQQGLLTLDLTNVGNTLIYGVSGSGKENLLTTVITSICTSHSPEEVNLYIFDFGAETLKIFNRFPQIGSIITVEDSDLLLDTLIMLDNECARRKDLFVDYAGNYNNYIKESGKKLPLLLIVINYYEIFMETNPKIADALNNLIRDGEKYGLKFIITTATNNSIRSRTAQLFNNKLSLYQNDPMEYRSLLGAPKDVIPKKIFGRGIVSANGTAYEFQTAFITEREDINSKIRKTTVELNEKFKTKAMSAIKLPEVVSYDMVAESIGNLTEVPIGYSNDTKEIYKYDFDKNPVTLILSNNIQEKYDFIYSLSKLLVNTKNTIVTTIDIENLLDANLISGNIIRENFDNMLIDIIKDVNLEAEGKKRIFVFNGFGKLKSKLNEKSIVYYNLLFDNITRFKNSKLILVDDYDSIKNIEIESWYMTTINQKCGIWLGKDFDEQMIINYESAPENLEKEEFNCVAVANENGVPNIFKYVILEKEK